MTDDKNQASLKIIDLFIDNSIKQFKNVYKASVKELGAQLIDKTPVYFAHESKSGNTRANWNISEGSVDSNYSESIADFSGEDTKKEIRGFMQKLKVHDGTTVFLSNSSPSIPSLEYGLYPNPPKKGSWNTQTQDYEIRSNNGYSLQAPVGISVVTENWSDIVRKKRMTKDTEFTGE
jgi:hypothetical protein